MAREESVTKVLDGDIFITASRKNRVRLVSVNAPEKGSSVAAAATQALRDVVRGQMVSVETVARDKYGPSVAKVTIGNLSVNAAMRRKGYK